MIFDPRDNQNILKPIFAFEKIVLLHIQFSILKKIEGHFRNSTSSILFSRHHFDIASCNYWWAANRGSTIYVANFSDFLKKNVKYSRKIEIFTENLPHKSYLVVSRFKSDLPPLDNVFSSTCTASDHICTHLLGYRIE